MKKTSNKKGLIISLIVSLILTVVLILIGEDRLYFGDRMLNIYIPFFKALKDSEKLLSHRTYVMVLGAVNRDYLFSELRLINLIYILFSPFGAYVLTFFMKMCMSVIGMHLLFNTILKDRAKDYILVEILLGLSYGLLPVESYFSFAIASIPLLVVLIISMKERIKVWGLILVFLYPVLSEFFHVGIYLLVIFLVFTVVTSTKNKKLNISWLLTFIFLFIGYAGTEYRFINMMYREGASFIKNVCYVFKGTDNLTLEVTILALMLVYSLSVVAILKTLVSVDNNIHFKKVAVFSAILFGVIIIVPLSGNPFTGSIVNKTRIKDFYSTDFFEKVKNEINYKEQWVCAYDLPTAALTYNGYRTIDGSSLISTPYIDEYDLILKEVVKSKTVTDSFEDIDVKAFKDLDGRLLISGRELNDADDNGFEFIKSVSDDNSPYTVYVYQTKSRYKDVEHADISYEERHPEYNLNLMYEDLDRMLELSNEALEVKNNNHKLSDTDIIADNKEEFLKLFDEFDSQLTNISTYYSLVNIKHCSDVSDDDLNQEMLDVYDEYMDISDKLGITLRQIVLTPFKEALKERLSDSTIDAYEDYEELTEEQKQRELKIQSLGQEYMQAVLENYYYDYEGETWDVEKYLTAAYADELSYEQRLAIYTGIYKEKAKVLTDIYLQLVKLNTEKAKEKGYDNYAEYAYKEIFGRDYTVEDAKRMFSDIKKCSRSFMDMQEIMDKVSEYDPGYITADDTKTYNMLYPTISTIDKELGDSLNYLLRNHLYNLKISPKKGDLGFTTTFPSYGDAFIFDSPYSVSRDLYTYTHEFGHFNAFINQKPDNFSGGTCLDISEIQSQGLELLVASRYNEMFDDNTALFLECNDVSSIFEAVSSGSIYGEFEIYAYEHPDADMTELGKAFANISRSHNYYYETEDGTMYDWIDIQHLFEQPMYYISYATSGLGALNIYEMSQNDYDLAAEKYMEMTTISGSMGFRDACAYVGLNDIFEKGNASKMLNSINSILKEKVNK